MKLPPSMKDNIGMLKGRYMILVCLVGITLLVVPIVGIVAWVESNQCAYQARSYGHPTRYHWPYGCFIRYDASHWLNINQYHGFKQVP